MESCPDCELSDREIRDKLWELEVWRGLQERHFSSEEVHFMDTLRRVYRERTGGEPVAAPKTPSEVSSRRDSLDSMPCKIEDEETDMEAVTRDMNELVQHRLFDRTLPCLINVDEHPLSMQSVWNIIASCYQTVVRSALRTFVVVLGCFCRLVFTLRNWPF